MNKQVCMYSYIGNIEPGACCFFFINKMQVEIEIGRLLYVVKHILLFSQGPESTYLLTMIHNSRISNQSFWLTTTTTTTTEDTRGEILHTLEIVCKLFVCSCDF